jgi:hypothetical protein
MTVFADRRKLLLIAEEGNFPPALYDLKTMMLTEGKVAEKEDGVAAEWDGSRGRGWDGS